MKLPIAGETDHDVHRVVAAPGADGVVAGAVNVHLIARRQYCHWLEIFDLEEIPRLRRGTPLEHRAPYRWQLALLLLQQHRAIRIVWIFVPQHLACSAPERVLGFCLRGQVDDVPVVFGMQQPRCQIVLMNTRA